MIICLSEASWQFQVATRCGPQLLSAARTRELEAFEARSAAEAIPLRVLGALEPLDELACRSGRISGRSSLKTALQLDTHRKKEVNLR